MFAARNQLLLRTASTVARTTKTIFGNDAKMVLVGGLAVTRLTNHHRLTTDIDFFVGGSLKPSTLKKELSRASRDFTINMEKINGITFRCPITKSITAIDFIGKNVGLKPGTESPDIGTGNLSWATRNDVISMKAYSASERFYDTKLTQDIADIQCILKIHPGPLEFPGSQYAQENRAFVRSFLSILVENSNWSKEEWWEKLGL